MNWIYDNHFMKLSRKLNLESKYELKLLPVIVSANKDRACAGDGAGVIKVRQNINSTTDEWYITTCTQYCAA